MMLDDIADVPDDMDFVDCGHYGNARRIVSAAHSIAKSDRLKRQRQLVRQQDEHVYDWIKNKYKTFSSALAYPTTFNKRADEEQRWANGD